MKECGIETVQKKEIDKKSPEHIFKKKLETQCKYFFKSKMYMSTKFKEPSKNIPKLDIQNFCHSNLTLSFHIIDSLENHDFIRKFVTNLNTAQDSKAFIIDSFNERSFVLNKSPTFLYYIEFINDFYSGKLEKLQRTTFIDVSKKPTLISLTELTAQSFTEVTYREHENVS